MYIYIYRYINIYILPAAAEPATVNGVPLGEVWAWAW